MRILVTNDDGISAPGITALWQALRPLGEIFVAAPAAERSGASHSITVHDPIRVDAQDFGCADVRGWRVGGTPADCVKLALEALLDAPPDLVISGVNDGPNLGGDVLYSGTVSAAAEGAKHGVLSLAVSLDGATKERFDAASACTARLLPLCLARRLPPGTLLNVNFPASFQGEASVVWTRLGRREYENAFERRTDPRGRDYYWMHGRPVEDGNGEGTDVAAVRRGCVAVTPIQFDLTDYTLLEKLRAPAPFEA